MRQPASRLLHADGLQPVPSRLFHNRGTGTFVDVTESSGIGSSYGPALGVLCADFNGDGRTDIFVANDTAANRLWVNQGDGTFREAALEAGVAYNADGRAKAGMGVTAEELDDDGTLTLLVTNLTREGATLFRGNRKGLFEDMTSQDGLATPTFGFTGFGTSWFDYDNDGRLDLVIANGAVTIVESLRAQPYPYGQSNLLFHNEGQHRFSDVSDGAGPAFQRLDVGRGVAIGDIDNDGALDVLVTNNNGSVRLLHNDVGPGSTGSKYRSARRAIGPASAHALRYCGTARRRGGAGAHDSSYLAAMCGFTGPQAFRCWVSWCNRRLQRNVGPGQTQPRCCPSARHGQTPIAS